MIPLFDRQVRGIVPDLAVFLQNVILLDLVRAVVAGEAQVIREHVEPIRQPRKAAHVVW